MNLPLVSVIITSYNRAPWIGQAIESALAQDYPNLEIIISDNCSQDNSDEVIKGYCADPRIRYSINDTNIGMVANLQKAFFELAKGAYVTNISSDDYLVNPRFISHAVNIFNSYENIAIVFGIHSSIDDKTRVESPSPLPGKYNIACKKGTDLFMEYADTPYYSSAGAVYSMGHLRKNNINFTGWVNADIEINLQLMLYGNIGFLNEVVYVIRLHAGNASGQFRDAKGLADMYLGVYRYIYKKALPVINDLKAMKTWRNKIMDKNIMLCLHMVLVKKDRKQMNLFNRLLLKEYRREYLSFLVRRPKYIAKVILNR